MVWKDFERHQKDFGKEEMKKLRGEMAARMKRQGCRST
jgi:hypothetical protein